MTEEKYRIVLDHPLDSTDLPGMKPVGEQSFYDRAACESIRNRHDRALQATRTPVDVPQLNETPAQYERRLTKALMKHCVTYQPMSLAKIPAPLFADIQETVLREAIAAPARNGQLVPIKVKDQVGRKTLEFEGRMSVWMDRFKAPLMKGVIVDDAGKPMRIPVGA